MEVPATWTVMDMKSYWYSMKHEETVKCDNLHAKLKALKKASHKKAELMQFLSNEGIPVTSNQTIAKMYSIAVHSITEDYEPTGMELVNFGKHAEMRFQELLDVHPSYVAWCKKQLQEDDSPDWRLRRLVM